MNLYVIAIINVNQICMCAVVFTVNSNANVLVMQMKIQNYLSDFYAKAVYVDL